MEHVLWKCLQANATVHYWWKVNIECHCAPLVKIQYWMPLDTIDENPILNATGHHWWNDEKPILNATVHHWWKTNIECHCTPLTKSQYWMPPYIIDEKPILNATGYHWWNAKFECHCTPLMKTNIECHWTRLVKSQYWMPQYIIDEKPILVQVMAWCRWAASKISWNNADKVPWYRIIWLVHNELRWIIITGQSYNTSDHQDNYNQQNILG